MDSAKHELYLPEQTERGSIFVPGQISIITKIGSDFTQT